MIRMACNAVSQAICDKVLCVAFMNDAVTSKNSALKPAVCTTVGQGNSGGDDALEALLAGYVSGTLSPAARALVASYIDLNPEIAALVEAMEVACGDSLMAIEPAPLSDAEGMLEAILAMPQDEAGDVHVLEAGGRDAGQSAPIDGDAILLPEPLREFLGLTEGDVPWKRSLAGFQECRVDGEDESSIRLLKLKAGQKMPDHGHHGLELTLVLSGAFSDSTGHYRRGSIQIADEHLDHQPIVDADSDCICFTVVEAPLRYRSPLTRMVAPLLDR
jgi:putative transcriptional regulator